MSTKPVLGYLGLGLMGAPMTRRLLQAGYDVHVWNRSPEKIAPLAAAGAIAAANPQAVAEAADIVMMCLTAAPAVEAVVFGDKGISSANGSGKILIDFSSMRPDLTRDFCARLKAANGMGWLDSPVSGGVPGAEGGTLAIMAGGSREDFDKASPVVAHLSQRYTLMGDSGAGQVTKLCNQILSGGAMILTAEAVSLARAAGIDATKLTEALAGGFADSKPFQIFGPRMAADQLEPKLGELSVMVKDLDTVFDVGRDHNVSTPMTAQMLELMRLLMAKGLGEEDIGILMRLYGQDRL